MTHPTTHRFDLRVYYEDTDLGGVVYHANYLKFIERARSEFVADRGIDQMAMRAAGVVFAVAALACRYRAPARLMDRLRVDTRLDRLTAARMELHQTVDGPAGRLFEADVTVVCMTLAGRPTRVPADIRAKMAPPSQ